MWQDSSGGPCRSIFSPGNSISRPTEPKIAETGSTDSPGGSLGGMYVGLLAWILPRWGLHLRQCPAAEGSVQEENAAVGCCQPTFRQVGAGWPTGFARRIWMGTNRVYSAEHWAQHQKRFSSPHQLKSTKSLRYWLRIRAHGMSRGGRMLHVSTSALVGEEKKGL